MAEALNENDGKCSPHFQNHESMSIKKHMMWDFLIVNWGCHERDSRKNQFQSKINLKQGR